MIEHQPGQVAFYCILFLFFSRRQDDEIDHMDDIVRCFDVGSNDLKVIDHDHPIKEGEEYFCAAQCSGGQTVGHISSHDLTRYDMLQEDTGQLASGVYEQGLDWTLGGFAKASSIGVKTVFGLSPLRAPANSAAVTASTSVSKEPAAKALSTISGSISLSSIITFSITSSSVTSSAVGTSYCSVTNAVQAEMSRRKNKWYG